jgi:hypothetical protein
MHSPSLEGFEEVKNYVEKERILSLFNFFKPQKTELLHLIFVVEEFSVR